jgi:hypothetical protein
MYVAEASLFIVATKMLWGFDIEYAKDEKGNNIPIDTFVYDGKFYLHVLSFFGGAMPTVLLNLRTDY